MGTVLFISEFDEVAFILPLGGGAFDPVIFIFKHFFGGGGGSAK